MAHGSDDRIRLGTGNSVRHLIKSGSCDLDTSMCHTRYIQNAIGFHFLFSITKPVPPQPKTMTDPPQLYRQRYAEYAVAVAVKHGTNCMPI